MYVYCERFDGTTQADTLLEVIMSSDGFSPKINWSSKREESLCKLVGEMFKQVPYGQRDYDATTYLWSFMGVSAIRVTTILELGVKNGMWPDLEIKHVTGLREKIRRGNLQWEPPKKEEVKFKEEEFFYSDPVGSAELSGDKLYEALATLLLIDVSELRNSDTTSLKRYYRKAALSYHPDRNNGDGSKMSELNMLWRIYNGG